MNDRQEGIEARARARGRRAFGLLLQALAGLLVVGTTGSVFAQAQPFLFAYPWPDRDACECARTELYGKMFVHVDLNRGSDAEFMLIPGVNANKLKALKVSRPWTSFAQCQTEMGKTANAAEVARIEQCVFIPIDLNTFDDAIMNSFARIGVGTRQRKSEFREYRPWTSMEQFEREIGKCVLSGPQELKRLQCYVIINE